MDPDETLDELREAVRGFREGGEDPHESADLISSRFEELDEWLCKRGFLPEDWVGAKSSLED